MVLPYVTALLSALVPTLVWIAGKALVQMLQLAIGGAAFLQQSRARCGDAFAVGVLPPRLVFLFDPAAIRHFFTAPVDQIDFRAAVEHFTQRVFQLSNEGFFPRHQRLWRGLRNLLTGSSVAARAAQLSAEIQEVSVETWPVGHEVDPLETVKASLFHSVCRLLFGRAFVVAHGSKALQAAFFDFEEAFELAASPLPHLLQPKFCRARRTLLGAFRTSVAARHFEGTIVGQLLAECDIADAEAPHVLLAVLWASMANSVPATFWTLALLLLPSSSGLLDDIRRAGKSTATSPVQQAQLAVQMALDARSTVRLAADEAIRLFSPSIDVRVAARDLTLPSGTGRTVSVRRGSILAVSPFISHRDTRLFPDAPGAFRPQRYATASAAAAGTEGCQPAGASADTSNGVSAKSAAETASQHDAGFSGSQRGAAAAAAGGDYDAHESLAADGSSSSAEPATGYGNGEPAANGHTHSKAEAADEFGAIPGVSQTGMAFGGGRFR